MKSYPFLIKKLYYEPLCITVEKFMAIHAVMESRLAGETHHLQERQSSPRVEDHDIARDGSTAIIPVTGIIGQHIPWVDTFSSGPMTDLDDVRTAIDVSEQDLSINRVLFNFDTPGGSAAGVPETARKIFNMTKPTVAFTDSECCSAGVWLASQANQFYATPSSAVGSVGVWSAYTDMTGKMEQDGVKMNSIVAGKYKLMGAWWKPMADEERDFLQAGVDKLHTEFKAAVNNRRVVDAKYLEGQVFDGDEASKLGFTDGVVEDIWSVLRGMVDSPA